MPSAPPTRAPFLYLLTLVGITALYYSAITSREVSLSFEQLSAFERSVFTFANTSVYTSTIGSDDKVLGRLSAEEWAKAAAGSVGVVALLYAPVHEVMAADTGGGGAWMAAALAAMAAPPGSPPPSSGGTAAAAPPPRSSRRRRRRCRRRLHLHRRRPADGALPLRLRRPVGLLCGGGCADGRP